MNRGHLIERVARDAGISKVAADRAIDSLLAGVSEGLKRGERVTFVGFGTFSVSIKRERAGRNPQTGAPIVIAEKKSVRFTVGKRLHSLLNRRKQSQAN
jgi:DNA-binding protein HU-beta